MKTCRICKAAKPRTEFYRMVRKLDGLDSRCKECAKAAVRANYRRRRDQYAAYERERYQQPKRRRDAVRLMQVRRDRNPTAYAARSAVSNALRGGRLTRQPCEVCCAPKVEAHHDDYTKPLDVRWLCRKHHLEHHGKVAYQTEAA